MVEYYTKGGKKIYNPAAYAKTGAPMYKKNNTTNIKIEQNHTNKYIKKHGYNNVRGGKYTNSKTLHKSNYNKYNNAEYYDESDDEESDDDFDY